MMLREPRNQKVKKRVAGPKRIAKSIGGFGASDGSSSGSISSAGDMMTFFFLGTSGSGAGAGALFAGVADSASFLGASSPSRLGPLSFGRLLFFLPPMMLPSLPP